MEFDALLLSRMQFAFTIAFHILFPAFTIGLAAYLAVLIAASLWMLLRHRSVCGLLAGPALAAMHLPWGAGFLTRLFREALR